MSDITAGWSNEVVFYLNGKRVVARDVQPDEFLVHYLRTKGLFLSDLERFLVMYFIF